MVDELMLHRRFTQLRIYISLQFLQPGEPGKPHIVSVFKVILEVSGSLIEAIQYCAGFHQIRLPTTLRTADKGGRMLLFSVVPKLILMHLHFNAAPDGCRDVLLIEPFQGRSQNHVQLQPLLGQCLFQGFQPVQVVVDHNPFNRHSYMPPKSIFCFISTSARAVQTRSRNACPLSQISLNRLPSCSSVDRS